jgi:hypothetical protein
VHLLNSTRHGVKVKRLINDIFKHGANPNNREGPGLTSLMLTFEMLNRSSRLDNEAGQHLMENAVSLLLQYGAEVNQQNFYGRTALHYALRSIYANSNHSEKRFAQIQRVVQILIQHNANI